MGAIQPFDPEKFVMAVLTGNRAALPAAERLLTEAWGPIDWRSPFLEFGFTHYYDREMGSPIERLFLSFAALVDPAGLAEIKIRTNEIERLLAEGGRRVVNLDPGLLALSRFSLATTKEAAHRLPLARGIYGEVTLVFEKGEFRALPWTYPDYRSETYRTLLGEVRRLYRGQLAAVQERPPGH